jgi:glycosyltransferase involved in cell wall biosynthesis
VKPDLTIAIPTYKRPTQLAALLDALAHQPDQRCEVIVLDNGNDPRIKDIVADNEILRAGYRPNIANVGLAGNVLRCFETGNGPLLWILGDDDEILPDAIQQILEVCDPQTDISQWNCSTFFVREQSFETEGIQQLLDRLDSFPNLNFISSNVYNRNRILPFISHGYQMAISICPHTAVTLAAAVNGARISFRSERICERPKPAPGEAWSWVQLAESMPLLCEMSCLSRRESLQLRRIIQSSGRVHDFFVASLVMNPKYHDDATSKYRHFRERWLASVSLTQSIKSLVYRALLLWPAGTKWIVEFAARRLGKSKVLDKYIEIARRDQSL